MYTTGKPIIFVGVGHIYEGASTRTGGGRNLDSCVYYCILPPRVRNAAPEPAAAGTNTRAYTTVSSPDA